MKKFVCLQVGLTENCNLLCRHCPRYEKVIGKPLSPSQVNYIVKQFNPSDFKWFLISDFGEIGTVKNLIAILGIIRKRGFKKIMTVSNLQILKKEIIYKIVKNELMQCIYISLESSKKGKYEHIRTGANYDRLSNNINLINAYKKEFKKKTPALIFNVVCMKSNLEDLPGIVDMANKFNIYKIVFVNLNSISNINGKSRKRNKLNTDEEHLSSCDTKQISKIFTIVEKKAKKYNIELEIPPNIKNNGAKKTEGPNGCTQPYKWIQLSTDGKLYPCCQISRKVSFGNIFNNSFEEIWNMKEYVDFRNGLLNGNPSKWCRECNVYTGYGF